MMDLIAGHRVTAVIYAAAKLGLADLIADGSRTAADLARLTDTHERSLLRLLRALSALGICTEAGDGTFGLTELGFYLTARSDARSRRMLFRGRYAQSGMGPDNQSIRTGKTASELAGGSRSALKKWPGKVWPQPRCSTSHGVGTRMQCGAVAATTSPQSRH
jgi:hypothetical protein